MCVSAKSVDALLQKAMYSRPRLLCRRWHTRQNAIRSFAEHTNEAWRLRITRLFSRQIARETDGCNSTPRSTAFLENLVGT
jgi:hypothetical protein